MLGATEWAETVHLAERLDGDAVVLAGIAVVLTTVGGEVGGWKV